MTKSRVRLIEVKPLAAAGGSAKAMLFQCGSGTPFE
jgi:hypothetical protein